MRVERFSFGSIQIDGVAYDHDVVLDRGEIRKRKKGPSRKFRDDFGHSHSRSRKTSRGAAAGSSSARAPVRCRS